MSAQTVDVRAVLDTVDACLHQLQMDADVKAMHIARFTAARSAVAELIEAVKRELNQLNGTATWRSQIDRAHDLRVALTGCGVQS